MVPNSTPETADNRTELITVSLITIVIRMLHPPGLWILFFVLSMSEAEVEAEARATVPFDLPTILDDAEVNTEQGAARILALQQVCSVVFPFFFVLGLKFLLFPPHPLAPMKPHTLNGFHFIQYSIGDLLVCHRCVPAAGFFTTFGTALVSLSLSLRLIMCS